MPRYLERVRKWLSRTVIAPVAAMVRETEAKCTTPRSSQSFQNDLLRIAQQYGIRVQPYLVSPTCSSVPYMIDRIKVLASGSFLQQYVWNGGPAAARDNMPTDAQVVMHAFCTFLDTIIPDGAATGRPFSSRFFLMHPDEPDVARKGSVVLYQRSIHPPHFEVVLDGQVWEVLPGRNNMFHAIVLFVLALKRHFHGHVGPISLSSPPVMLIPALETDADRL
jgi:hypothetical protein